MSYIKKFDNYKPLYESQSKKLKKYFTFSVVLEWYRLNKVKIASILGCDVDDLASEDTLMEQSYGLVNHVINPQDSGNDGRDDNKIAGFSDFKELEKNLIHDILHNMYHVQEKEFRKSLSDVEYSESEIFEEIEVLGIEESFMKFMNIKYPKTDFINQNLNLLASHLMMTILKHDPERIEKILDEKVEPYLEIYGKQYNVENSAYEKFFELFDNKQADSSMSRYDFKDYMIDLINVGVGIDDSGGDRAQYPNYEYFGNMSWYDIDDYDKKEFIENNFNDGGYKTTNIYLTDKNSLLNLEDLNSDIELYYVDITEEDDETDIYHQDVHKSPNQIELFSDYKKEKNNKIVSKFRLPIKNSFIEDDGDIDMYAWVEYLAKYFNIELYELDGDSYFGASKNTETGKITYLDKENFDDVCNEIYNDNDNDNNYPNSHEFIKKDEYRKKSFKEITEILFKNSEAVAIMRRNFRTNDVIKNNTKLGNLPTSRSRWNQKEIKTKNPNDNFIDFVGSEFASDKSISKNLLTDNAKKLTYLLNDLRGYVIKNANKIKDNFKEKTNKFSKEEITKFRNINIDKMITLLNVDINNQDNILYGTITQHTSDNQYTIIFDTNKGIFSNIVAYNKNIKEFEDFKNKINSQEDIDFLMNYVNKKGSLKTPADFKKFEKLFTDIKNKESEIIDKKYLTLLNDLKNKEIKITKEEYDSLKGLSTNKLNKEVYNLIKKYLPILDFKIKDVYKYEYNNFINFQLEIK